MSTGRKDTRLFARLDLDYADHPKIGQLSDAAFRAHVEMILYARKYMTDGIIPQRVAKRFASEPLSELLANDAANPSLVDLGDGTYRLHGYADMNETRAEIQHRSRVNAENGRRGGLSKSRIASRPAKRAASDSVSEDGGENVAETETETDTPPKGGVPRKRGTRIPEPFVVTLEMREWAAGRVPLVNVDSSTERFVNHWRAKAGKDATKLDWLATWRNWLIRDQDDRANRPKLTPTERAMQTAAAGRQFVGRTLTTLELESGTA